VIEKLSVFVL